MHVCAIIPAAGRSERFGQGDKLMQDLGGRPLLVRTVELFTRRDEVRSIVVAGPPDEFDQFKERFGATLGFHGATLVPGGRAARAETVKAALDAVPEEATHILVHDAARPGTDKDLLDRVLESARTLDAVIPVVAVADTIKRVAAAGERIEGGDDAIADLILGDAGKVAVETKPVEVTLDRTNLVAAQTPQVFKVSVLRAAYAQDDIASATDDAALVERLGETVHTVDGDVRNFKVTTAADLHLMRAVLGVKPPAERPAHKRF